MLTVLTRSLRSTELLVQYPDVTLLEIREGRTGTEVGYSDFPCKS
jgi:hypothetical protein